MVLLVGEAEVRIIDREQEVDKLPAVGVLDSLISVNVLKRDLCDLLEGVLKFPEGQLVVLVSIQWDFILRRHKVSR